MLSSHQNDGTVVEMPSLVADYVDLPHFSPSDFLFYLVFVYTCAWEEGKANSIGNGRQVSGKLQMAASKNDFLHSVLTTIHQIRQIYQERPNTFLSPLVPILSVAWEMWLGQRRKAWEAGARSHKGKRMKKKTKLETMSEWSKINPLFRQQSGRNSRMDETGPPTASATPWKPLLFSWTAVLFLSQLQRSFSWCGYWSVWDSSSSFAANCVLLTVRLLLLPEARLPTRRPPVLCWPWGKGRPLQFCCLCLLSDRRRSLLNIARSLLFVPLLPGPHHIALQSCIFLSLEPPQSWVRNWGGKKYNSRFQNPE